MGQGVRVVVGRREEEKERVRKCSTVNDGCE